MNSSSASPASSAWRQPVFWLVLGLPLLGIVAGVGIVAAAVSSGGSDALSSAVRRTAQIQQEDTAADLAALQRGLKAQLQRDSTGLLSLTLSGAVDADELELQLLHPLQARQDRRVRLRRAGERWFSDGAAAVDGRWNLRLQPRDGSWRLAGRLETDAAHVTLQPLWQQ